MGKEFLEILSTHPDESSQKKGVKKTMLKTQGIFEGNPNGNYKIHTEVYTLVGTVPAEIMSASNLGLQKPYGEQVLGFGAGMIAQLKADSGETKVTISDGTMPCGIFADSFVDCLKSGKATYYEFFGDYFTDIIDPAGTYTAVGTLLYVVASGADKGKLTTVVAGLPVGVITQSPDLVNGVLLGFTWKPAIN